MTTEITGAQIRAARAFLNWSRMDLAKAASVGPATVQIIEDAGDKRPTVSERPNGMEYRASAREESVRKIVGALLKAGVTFLSDDGKGPGVRRKKKGGRPTLNL